MPPTYERECSSKYTNAQFQLPLMIYFSVIKYKTFLTLSNQLKILNSQTLEKKKKTDFNFHLPPLSLSQPVPSKPNFKHHHYIFNSHHMVFQTLCNLTQSLSLSQAVKPMQASRFTNTTCFPCGPVAINVQAWSLKWTPDAICSVLAYPIVLTSAVGQFQK